MLHGAREVQTRNRECAAGGIFTSRVDTGSRGDEQFAG